MLRSPLKVHSKPAKPAGTCGGSSSGSGGVNGSTGSAGRRGSNGRRGSHGTVVVEVVVVVVVIAFNCMVSGDMVPQPFNKSNMETIVWWSAVGEKSLNREAEGRPPCGGAQKGGKFT